MNKIILSCVFILGLGVAPAMALTERQSQGMRFHGSWDWVIRTCPGFHRSYGYWFALKEVGGFKNQIQIVENEGNQDYQDGWDSMRNRAGLNGLVSACDYALKTWPAVFIKAD